jgi:hypothetical protein
LEDSVYKSPTRCEEKSVHRPSPTLLFLFFLKLLFFFGCVYRKEFRYTQVPLGRNPEKN